MRRWITLVVLCGLVLTVGAACSNKSTSTKATTPTATKIVATSTRSTVPTNTPPAPTATRPPAPADTPVPPAPTQPPPQQQQSQPTQPPPMSAEDAAYRDQLISDCSQFTITPICVCIADRLIPQYGARSAYERYATAVQNLGTLEAWLDTNGVRSCFNG